MLTSRRHGQRQMTLHRSAAASATCLNTDDAVFLAVCFRVDQLPINSDGRVHRPGQSISERTCMFFYVRIAVSLCV